MSRRDVAVSVDADDARLVRVDADRVRVALAADDAPPVPGATATVAFEAGAGAVLVDTVAGRSDPTGTDLYFVERDPLRSSADPRRRTVRIVPDPREIEVAIEAADGALVQARVVDLGEGGLCLEHAPCQADGVQLLLPGRSFPLALPVDTRHAREVAGGTVCAGYAFAWDRTEGAERQREAIARYVEAYCARVARRLG